MWLTHRLYCSYFFNLPKGSLLSVPLKLEATSIWLPHMSHHHPQTPFSSSSAETLQELAYLPQLFLGFCSEKCPSDIWAYLNVASLKHLVNSVFFVSSFPFALLVPSNSEKEARLISRGFSWQIEKCSRDCSRVKEKRSSQFWNGLRVSRMSG